MMDGDKKSAAAIVRLNKDAISAARATGEDVTAICGRYVTGGVKASALKAAYYRILRDEKPIGAPVSPAASAKEAFAVIDLALRQAEATTQRDLFAELIADPDYAARIRGGIDRIGLAAVRKIVAESGVKVTEKRFRDWYRAAAHGVAASDEKPVESGDKGAASIAPERSDAEKSPKSNKTEVMSAMAGQRSPAKDL